MKSELILPIAALALALFIAGCTAPGTGTGPEGIPENLGRDNTSRLCAQVITTACNPSTGELTTFPTACIDEGWTSNLSQCPAGIEESVSEAQSASDLGAELDDLNVSDIVDSL